MALIAVAADKGSPGVTTSAVALAAVWPRPVLLAECDPAGGDLVFRLPAADRGRLDTRRGLLSLAVAARRGMAPRQVWEHVQKVHGGLDVLAGVTSAEQAAGLQALWGTVGTVLAGLPEADVIADCGRIGVDGPFYDLLAHAAATLLITGASLGEVIRLRERATAVAAGLQRRGRPGIKIQAVIIARPRHLNAALSEVAHALGKGSPATVAGGIAHDPKSAESLAGEWGGKLDKSMLIRTARQIAAELAGQLPPLAGPGVAGPDIAPVSADRQLPGATRESRAPGRRPAVELAAGQIVPTPAPAPPARLVPVPPGRPTPVPPVVTPVGRVPVPRGRHADPAQLPPAQLPPAQLPPAQYPPEPSDEFSPAERDDNLARWPGSFAPAAGSSPDASGQW